MGHAARTLVLALAALIAVSGLTGCGLGAGSGTGDVKVTVTRDFGSREVGSVTKAKVPGSETVMRLLERSFRVQTRYGGGFVQSIDGLAGSASRRDWFYYVNGIEAPKGAASTSVHRGDRIWWDLHDWSATDSVPAVVGAFPEPFVHGVGGRRLPTSLECAPDVKTACDRVAAALTKVGVPVAQQLFGTGSGADTLTVIVATGRELRSEIVGSVIQQGPGASGVYARFAGPGSASLQLLNPRGQVVKTLGAGAGLLAATAGHAAVPTWIISGTDPAGVAAAAAALGPGRLQDHFAIAVQGASDLPIPLRGGT